MYVVCLYPVSACYVCVSAHTISVNILVIIFANTLFIYCIVVIFGLTIHQNVQVILRHS